jgi:hypothetical protein
MTGTNAQANVKGVLVITGRVSIGPIPVFPKHPSLPKLSIIMQIDKAQFKRILEEYELFYLSLLKKPAAARSPRSVPHRWKVNG